jgi:hypothetical protein
MDDKELFAFGDDMSRRHVALCQTLVSGRTFRQAHREFADFLLTITLAGRTRSWGKPHLTGIWRRAGLFLPTRCSARTSRGGNTSPTSASRNWAASLAGAAPSGLAVETVVADGENWLFAKDHAGCISRSIPLRVFPVESMMLKFHTKG